MVRFASSTPSWALDYLRGVEREAAYAIEDEDEALGAASYSRTPRGWSAPSVYFGDASLTDEPEGSLAADNEVPTVTRWPARTHERRRTGRRGRGHPGYLASHPGAVSRALSCT